MPRDLPKKDDKTDVRCALAGQEVHGEKVSCAPINQDEDWCYGCKFYICENHSVNISLMDHHDAMEHTNAFDDAEGDDE